MSININKNDVILPVSGLYKPPRVSSNSAFCRLKLLATLLETISDNLYVEKLLHIVLIGTNNIVGRGVGSVDISTPPSSCNS